MKKILILAIILIISGCAANKNVDKKKTEEKIEQNTDTQQAGTIVTEETQEGGRTEGEIIPIEHRERDDLGELKEMVQEIKDGAVTQRVIYRTDGSVKVECEVEALQRKIIEIYERQEQVRIEQEKKQSEKQKEEGFKMSDAWILGIFGTIIALGGLVIFLMFKKIDASSKLFQEAITNFSK